MVKSLELPLHYLELLLRNLDFLLQILEARFHVVDIARARLVLFGAEVLDLFAGVLDLCQTQCRAAPFEEVTESGELFEIAGVSAERRREYVRKGDTRGVNGVSGIFYSFESIF